MSDDKKTKQQSKRENKRLREPVTEQTVSQEAAAEIPLQSYADTAAEKQGKKKKPYLTETELRRRKVKRTRVATASFVLLLAIGILGNWYFDNTRISTTMEPLLSGKERTKTLGEAEFVDATTQLQEQENDYFSEARMNRQNARDEAIDKLTQILDKTDEKEEARKEAADKMAQLSENIANENKIETLVTAKGVDNCLAVISEDGDKVDVIVDAEELSDTLIVQIKDIAMSQMDCSFEAVSIIQSK